MRTTNLGFTTTKNHHWSGPWQHSTIADLGYNNTAHLSSWWTQHTRHPNRLTTLTDSTAPIERAIFGFSRKPKNLVAPNLKARLLQETQKLKNSKNPKTRFLQDSDSLGKPKTWRLQTNRPPKPSPASTYWFFLLICISLSLTFSISLALFLS